MKPGPGSILIAPPSMSDTRFANSVLFVTHNNNAGTFALCLNRPTKHTAVSLSQELKLDKELPFQMYWGGPVNHGSIWMIHDNTWHNDDTMYVNATWNVTSNESMFHHMADGDAPRNFRLCFGFCSWMPEQLNMELAGVAPFSKKSSWLYANDVDPEWVFETPVEHLWESATELAADEAISNWL